MSPQERLLRNEDIIKLVLEHEYLPQASSVGFGEILGALREINPTAKYDTGCSGCMMEIVRMANFHLQSYKNQPKFHTFPNQKKRK